MQNAIYIFHGLCILWHIITILLNLNVHYASHHLYMLVKIMYGSRASYARILIFTYNLFMYTFIYILPSKKFYFHSKLRNIDAQVN